MDDYSEEKNELEKGGEKRKCRSFFTSPKVLHSHADQHSNSGNFIPAGKGLG